MTNLFVMTCKRPQDPWAHLLSTVKQAEEEGISCDVRKGIVLDGPAEDLEAAQEAIGAELGGAAASWWWSRFERPAGTFRGGNKLPYWYILELAHRLGGDALILEDDLEAAGAAFLRALVFPVPDDVDLVQFFAGWTLTDPHAQPGLWRTPSTIQGCQAIKYPHRTLDRLVAWSRRPEFQKYDASDMALELARRRLELRPACHCPDLFEHDGGDSAVDAGTVLEGGNTDELTLGRIKNSLAGRRSHTWPGKNFDSMRLFARHELYK